ncbi:putative Potassium transporter 5 [Cocos nucifera]|nr:putative Potassium transporter 5 [Cocos nucifera]
MLITTFMVTLIMIVIWKTNIWLIILFCSVFSAIEILYLSTVLYKFVDGGFLPLAFSFFMMLIMGVWHYVHVKRYKFELKHRVSRDYITQLALKQDVRRIPGVGFLYTELVQGIPPIFSHLVEKIPSIHSVLVFVSIKHLPISRVEMEERFLFRQIGPRDYRMFRCVVRYGYKDVLEEAKEFELLLIEQLKQFIHHEYFFLESGPPKQSDPLPEAANLASSALETSETKTQRSGSSTVHVEETLKPQSSPNVSSRSIHHGISKCSTNSSGRSTVAQIPSVEEEKQFVQKEMEKGVVYLLAEAEVIAENNSSIVKKLVVNYIYNFIRRNIRQGEKALSIPRGKLLKVGMTYEI